MSHFTKLATRLIDEQTIKEALRSMGFEAIPPGPGVKGWLGSTAKADFKISPEATNHEIGFVKSPRGYEVIADWFNMGLSQKKFVSDLTREYAITATKATLLRDGYQLTEEVTSGDGVVRLVLSRYTGM